MNFAMYSKKDSIIDSDNILHVFVSYFSIDIDIHVCAMHSLIVEGSK